MKNAVKYLVLSISCVICFVVLVLMVGLLFDINNLSYPSTLILPMLSGELLVGGLIMLIVWAFKFSNNKPHKKFLIISLSLLIASVVVFISARAINTKVIETAEAKYFNSTTIEN